MEECRRIESRPRLAEEELGVRMRRSIFSRLVSRRCLISISLLT
jgi:hypothetical protein